MIFERQFAGEETALGAVLLIDDDLDFLLTTSRVLRRAGYAVQAAGSGREGLKLFARHPADVVITDILMPDIEGMATILELRRQRPSPKILAISGGGYYGRLQYLDWAKALGADAALAKPFRISQLLTAMRQLMTGVV